MFSAWFTVCCVAKIGPFRNFCETGLSLSWMRVLWWFTTKNKLAKLIKMLTISVWWSCVWVLNHVTDLHCLFFASISRPHFILTLPALSSQHICFLFYSSMLFYSICSLFTFFSSLRTFPSSFPDLLFPSWSHQGRVSQPPVCPSLDVPPPPPVPQITQSLQRVPLFPFLHHSQPASAKRQLLPFRLPQCLPFRHPSKHSPHRPPCFIISPLPRTLSAGTRAAGGMGIERGHSRGCGVPTRGGGGGTALTVFRHSGRAGGTWPGQAGTTLAPTAVRQISSPSAWCVTCMKHLLGLSLWLSWVFEPRKKVTNYISF